MIGCNLGLLLVLLGALLLSLAPAGRALVITPADGYKRVYKHMTAEFGPSRFNVTGRLALGKDVEDRETLCKPSQQRHDGQVLLVLRGTCSFAQKALNAQDAGAVAVVVGNDRNSEDKLVKMGRSSGDGSGAVTIPAIFVTYGTYSSLSASLSQPGVEIDAIVNRTGEVMMVFDTLGWISFMLPFFGITLALMCVYYCRRRLINRRRRVVRVDAAARLPIVEWQPSPDSELAGALEHGRLAPPPDVSIQLGEEAKLDRVEEGEHLIVDGQPDSSMERLLNADDPRPDTDRSSAVPASTRSGSRRSRSPQGRVLNDTCVICLTDFEVGEQVKALPCHHGFHAVCIDPWLNERSDECPICKASVTAALEAQESCWRSCC